MKFQLRKDLQFSEYASGQNVQLVVKDPVKLEYFLFQSLDRVMLNLLKQPLTAIELSERASHENPTAISEVEAFLQRMQKDNLIVTSSTGAGDSLRVCQLQDRRNAKLQFVFGVLAIRFRGIDPQNVLHSISPIAQFLFQPACMLLAGAMFVVALLTMSLNAHRILASTEMWASLHDPVTYLWIALAVVVVKVLHELGHALACHSIGRNCHEMGIMLLAFIPCLYCNVSDVWMERSRWKRMLVSAAGIYIEMLIAAICVPLWIMCTDGQLQIFLFAMITIGSLNTLLINGNPLLRYDGYYLLSDFWGVPNLYAESQKRVDRRVHRLFFADEPILDWSFLDVYGILSRGYRTLILAAILFGIYSFFANMELPNLGLGIASTLGILTFAGTVVGTSTKLMRCDWGRFRFFSGLWLVMFCGAVLVGVLWIPIQTRVYASGDVGQAGGGVIYAPREGRIIWSVGPGEKVAKGECIGRIENEDLKYSIFEQEQRIGELELSLKNIETIQKVSRQDHSAEIELSKSALENSKKVIVEYQRQYQRLRIEALANGELQMLPTTAEGDPNGNHLERTSSTMLPECQGAFVKPSEPIGLIASPERLRINLDVPETQIRHVEVGQPVEVLIPQYSTHYLCGRVVEVCEQNTLGEAEEKRHPLTSDGFVVVRVQLDKSEFPLYQSAVHAVIKGESVRIYQWLRQKFVENFL